MVWARRPARGGSRMLPFISVLVLIAGAGLVVTGLRGRRVNEHPVCRACRFDLVGVHPGAARCPECGAVLGGERAVRIGVRRRRRGPLAAGALLILAALVWGGGLTAARAAGVSWQRHMPTGWLIARVESAGGPASAGHALSELTARHADDELSREHIERLAAAALAWQADRTRFWSHRCGDLLFALDARGDLSEEQAALFRRQAIAATTRTRSPAREGTPLPFELSYSLDRGGNTGAMFLQYTLARVEMNGVVVSERPGGGFGRSTLSGPGGQSTSTTRVDPGAPVGEHQITAVWSLSVMSSMDETAATIASWEVGTPQLVRIVDHDQALVTLVDDPQRAGLVRDQIEVERVRVQRLAGDRAYGSIQIRSDRRATSVAMEVFLVTPDAEWRLGTITMPAGEGSYSASVGGDIGLFEGSRVRVDLRPSPAAAEGTVDLVEILGRPLVYEGVPVERPE